MAEDPMAEELLIPTDEASQVVLKEVLAVSGLAGEEVIELIEIGAFQLAGSSPVWTFHASTITLARRACRLRDTFDLNVSGIALALTYLERIEQLERRLRELESQLPRWGPGISKITTFAREPVPLPTHSPRSAAGVVYMKMGDPNHI